MQDLRKGGSATFRKLKKRIADVNSCWSPIELHENHCKVLIPTFVNGFTESYDFCKACDHYKDYSLQELKDYIPFIPTENDCKQLVIGPLELLAPYLSYISKDPTAPFFVSTAKDWTIDLNRILISCGMLTNLHNKGCQYSVRLLIPKNLDKLFIDNTIPRTTILELCIVLQYVHNFEVYKVDGLKSDYDLILLEKK